jgi:hypothetical protein
MPEYEHLFIRKGPKIQGPFVDLNTVSYTENGQEMPYDGEEMWDVANQKGSHGWEVVSATEDASGWHLILKREKLATQL